MPLRKKEIVNRRVQSVPTGAFIAAALLLLAAVAVGAGEDKERVVETRVSAIEAYETGFAHDVMRSSDGASVQLNDMVLIENDAPGAGWSQMGSFLEPIHQNVLARKTLHLDRAAARTAHVVLYMIPQRRGELQAPYYVLVNGRRIEGNPVPWHEGTWHWVKVPVSLFKPGANEIIVGCDAAPGEGYDLLFARDDEYARGGGRHTCQGNTAMICAGQITLAEAKADASFQEIDVGASSARSIDGGATWQLGRLGPSGGVQGEYTVRLNLSRYKRRGTLQSGVVDLWAKTPQVAELIPHCQVNSLQLEVAAETPPETQVVWSVRLADTPNIRSAQGSDFQFVGSCAKGILPVKHGNNRYLQWHAELTTDNPMRSPRVDAVTVHRRLRIRSQPEGDVRIIGWDNVAHRYGSYTVAYEDPRHSTLLALRKRMQLDALLKNTADDFERINRLRHRVSSLWKHALPDTDYPEWNAMDILDRNDRLGSGGMCHQYSIVFIQALQSVGYHARHVNLFAHETVEVYVDPLGKWVVVDPESVFDSYEYNTQTGIPVNALDQHAFFLRRYGFSAEAPIDWMRTTPWAWPDPNVKGEPQPLAYSTSTPELNNPDNRPPQHRLAGFVRFIPRNDYLSRPSPRPVNQGLRCMWPWNGYVNWYDPATPRKLQYALHSDRVADFYPTLNRVEFIATEGDEPGQLIITLLTVAPHFETFEVDVDQSGWKESLSEFAWSLRPGAVNTLAMRVRNTVGPAGRPSRLRVLWHHGAPSSIRE